MHVIPSATTPYINTHSGQPGAGMVRWNPNTNCLEITDGMSWHQYRLGATIDLSSDAQNALSWAYAKMQEEAQLEQLMDQHPGLRDCYDRFQVMLRLVQHESNESNPI
jgi:hypothetical protein